MSRHLGWRLLAVIALLGAASALVLSRPARLGLDLRGGTQIVLEASDSDRQRVDRDTIDRTLEVLRRRVDQLGVTEPTLQRSGDRRVIVELPGVYDPAEAVRVIGRTAQLAFHPVLGTAETQRRPSAGELVLPDEQGARLRLGAAALDGGVVGDARAELDPQVRSRWQVAIDFRGAGGRQWAELTGKAACRQPGDPARRVAITLDRQVISSPQVDPSIRCGQGITGGTTVITGDFTDREARDLALLIRAGALPVPVGVVEQRTVGPTLGAEAIRASTQAAVIGVSLTILFMALYYRLLGALSAAVLLVLATAGLVVRGPNMGLEFTGGRLLEYSTQRPVDLDAARAALADAGFARAVVQGSGDGDVSVRTGQVDAAGERRIERAIESVGGSAERLRSEFIGPTIGAELRRKAVIAVGIALAAQLAYMAVRFRWTFGTYSSVFVAAPLVVALERGRRGTARPGGVMLAREPSTAGPAMRKRRR